MDQHSLCCRGTYYPIGFWCHLRLYSIQKMWSSIFENVSFSFLNQSCHQRNRLLRENIGPCHSGWAAWETDEQFFTGYRGKQLISDPVIKDSRVCVSLRAGISLTKGTDFAVSRQFVVGTEMLLYHKGSWRQRQASTLLGSYQSFRCPTTPWFRPAKHCTRNFPFSLLLV